MGTETVSKVKGKINTALFKIQSSSTFWKTLSFINFPSKIFLQIFSNTGIPEEIQIINNNKNTYLQLEKFTYLDNGSPGFQTTLKKLVATMQSLLIVFSFIPNFLALNLFLKLKLKMNRASLNFINRNTHTSP